MHLEEMNVKKSEEMKVILNSISFQKSHLLIYPHIHFHLFHFYWNKIEKITPCLCVQQGKKKEEKTHIKMLLTKRVSFLTEP